MRIIITTRKTDEEVNELMCIKMGGIQMHIGFLPPSCHLQPFPCVNTQEGPRENTNHGVGEVRGILRISEPISPFRELGS